MTALLSPMVFEPAPRVAPKADTSGLARRFWYSIRRWWWSAYFRIEVGGLEHVPTRGAVLLCGNHASHLDAPAILAALPRDLALRASTAAAGDVFGDEHPFQGAVGRLTTNALPIQREAEFAKGLRTLERVLDEGRPLVLFPEGKRSSDGGLLPFKPGAAMLAIRTGAPIVPVRLDGVNKALPKGSRLPTAADVTVRFGEPIDPRPLAKAIEEGRLSRREAYAALTETLRAAIDSMKPVERETRDVH
jgi:1-acyl-sn-glycerol-3-phosphate acyltransferase